MASSREPDEAPDGPRSEETVSRLFDEWLTARERGEEASLEDLLERAGPDARVLRQRIHLYDALEELGDGPPREDEGRRLGRFQLLGTLGSGGLGTVHHALDPELKREVALKVLNAGAGDGAGWLLNEARSLARIHHSGVVRVYEVQRSGPAYLVVMEYLAGPALDRVIHELRELKRSLLETGSVKHEGEPSLARLTAERLEPISTRVRILHHLAEALAHCHDREVLHRDVKPGNVVFDAKGLPRLIDFGLAHKGGPRQADETLAITESLVASPAYMAPEQVESERTGADPRTDQFSFGVLAYELLTLRHPFSGDGRVQTMEAIARAAPPRPRALVTTLPDDLERIVLHALERDPRERYPSMGALAADLLAVMERRPISLRRPGQLARAQRFFRQHRRGVRAAGLSLLVALVTALAFTFQRVVEARQNIELQLEGLEAGFDSAEYPQDYVELASNILDLRTRLAAQGLGGGSARQQRRLEELEARLGREVSAGAYAAEDFYEALTRNLLTARRNVFELTLLDWLRLIQTLGRSFQGVELAPYLASMSMLTIDAPGLQGAELRTYELAPAANIHPFFTPATTLAPVELRERPFPGRYRFVAVDQQSGRVVAEAGLQLYDVWRPARHVRLRTPDAELFERARPVERMRILPHALYPHEPARHEPSVEGPTLLLPAYRITPQHVTRGEFERFARAEGFRPTLTDRYPDTHVDTDPAWTTPTEAARYATAHGGRLPTALELAIAEREGILALETLHYPPDRRPANKVFGNRDGEYVRANADWITSGGGEANPRDPQYLHLFRKFLDDPGARAGYPFPAITDHESRATWLNYLDRKPEDPGDMMPLVIAGMTFRVVFPDDTIDAYDQGTPRPMHPPHPSEARAGFPDTPTERDE